MPTPEDVRRVLPPNVMECMSGTRFSMAGYRIGSPGARATFGHERIGAYIARARDLDLRGNWIGDVGLAALARSPVAPNLRSLDLTDCQITVQGVPFLDAFPQLRTLDLSDNPLGPEGARALSDLDLGKRLHELSLAGTLIGDEGLRHLRLRVRTDHLDLGSCGLQRDLGAAPGQALHPRASLFLGDNPLGDEGAAALAAWGPQPVQVSLQYTGLTDRGLEALVTAGVLSRATYIDLRGNPLSADHLGDVPWRDNGVVKLGSSGRISLRDVAALRRAHPDARILFDAVDDGFALACPYCLHLHDQDHPRCPHCAGDVTRDASIEVAQGHQPLCDDDCPHCDASVPARAMRCPRCRSWLPPHRVR